ncbi:MAG: dihydrofolate reductase [Clostridia bacterium]|nr:dihydrofolate reductase [Clostridia bacterium]
MDLIVAADRGLAIGKNGTLLYSVPEDMKYFRRMTQGKTVVMGRKTLESFPGGKPLKNRINSVLSSDKSFAPEGVVAVHSIDELLAEVGQYPADDVMLIGGASLYNLLYTKCRRAYVTWIDAIDPDADSFIPDFHRLEGWRLESESAAVETGGYTVHFACYLNTAL